MPPWFGFYEINHEERRKSSNNSCHESPETASRVPAVINLSWHVRLGVIINPVGFAPLVYAQEAVTTYQLIRA